jgi:AbrB family looped-hinge helix DNA binding protein
MSTATVTSKGQITIPKKVREQLRLRTGDRVLFHIEPDGSVKLQPIAKKVSEVFGAFSFKAARVHSPSEMKQRVTKAFRNGKL